MKKVISFLLIVFVMARFSSMAQVSINTDASQPDASSMLDIKSTGKGILVPRLTSAQRTAIVNPAAGLCVFDMDVLSFWFYTLSSGWVRMANSSDLFKIPYDAAMNSVSPLFDLVNTNPGIGSTAVFVNNNSSNTGNTLAATNYGIGVIGDNSKGNAGSFLVNNVFSVAAGVRGEAKGAYSNDGCAGVCGISSGQGAYAGYFEHTESSGYVSTVEIKSRDHGPALQVDQDGDGFLAVFRVATNNVAKIDITGKGYFDGGTQTGGADLAEAFDVDGNAKQYEPGDVLDIAINADRKVVKCSTAYSTLVAGVYATKPGVLLTEETGCSAVAGKIPMGVIGVIPTKVCNQNGEVHRGDILVTSDRPGYAMKADLNKLRAGQAVGKALEELKGSSGKILVLVNVR